MTICMTARYRVQPEMVEECKRTIIDFVKYIRINEPTTLFYMANQEMGHPTQFLHTMIFEDEHAVTVHQASPATQRFVDMIVELVQEQTEGVGVEQHDRGMGAGEGAAKPRWDSRSRSLLSAESRPRDNADGPRAS